MTQVTAAMQKIIDRFGWAERLPSVAEAAQSLARHVDARLTALEAAKPKDADQQARELIAEIHSLEMDAYQAEEDLAESEAENDRLTAEIKRLRADNANLEAAKNYWLNGSGTLLWRLDALEAQRNTLAAEVDDLRNINAGLRKHSASQQDLLVSGRLRSLRRIEAILAVEWVTGECPWCGNSHREGHDENCQRQAALR